MGAIFDALHCLFSTYTRSRLDGGRVEFGENQI